MASVWAELKRRNVFKVGAAYAIVAWLLIQIADVFLPTFEAPAWVMQVFAFFIVLGFPIALLLAWAYEMTPQGIRAAADVEPGDPITRAPGHGLNYVILGLVVLAVSFLLVDRYLLEPRVNLMEARNATALPAAPSTSGLSNRPVRRYTMDLVSGQTIGNTGLSAHLALSPDGTRLVYAAELDGSVQLYLRPLDQLGTRPMPGTEGAYLPFFSPDGEWVGFYSDATDQKLKKVSVRGGSVQILADAFFSTGASWGPEDTIVFGTGTADSGRSLFRIPAAGGTPDTLVVPEPATGHVKPTVLPDGNAVLLVIRRSGGPARDGSLAVLSLATGELRVLMDGGFAPQYAPTGHVVFAQAGALWAMPFDADRLEATGPAVPVVENVQQEGVFGNAAYSFSSDGLLVYVPGGGADVSVVRNLVWVGRDGREEPLATAPLSYSEPRVSPDGRRLALTIEEDGNRDVWIYDTTAETLRRLTFEPGTDDHPVWTPDGERVVFTSSRDGGGLFWKSADGTGQSERIANGTIFTRAESFSPDGQQLIFRDPGAAVWGMHILSLEEEIARQPLLVTPFDSFLGAVSPDGQWLAYTSDETGRNEVYVRPFPNLDDGKWQVSTDGGEEPLWGPESRELFYRIAAGNAVLSVAIETDPSFTAARPEVLFTGDSLGFGTRPSYDVSDDGQRFLMMKDASGDADAMPAESEQTSLIVVENWFEELTRLARPSVGE